MYRELSFIILIISLQIAFAQNGSKLDSHIASLDYFLGTWSAMAQGPNGKPIMYSVHTVKPILGGKFIKRTVIQGFNGLQLLPYTEEIIGYNIAKKEIEMSSHNKPGFIIHGTIEIKDEKKFTRNWILYDLKGQLVTGKDTWTIIDHNSFQWELHFSTDGKWEEAPFSPFVVHRSNIEE